MKKKNRKFRAAVCIGVAVFILTMAVFANYDNANGYSTIKTAAKNIMYSDNYTISFNASADVGGINLGKYDGSIKIDKNGEAIMQKIINHTGESSSTTSFEAIQDGYKMNSYSVSVREDYITKYKHQISEDDYPMCMDKDNEVFTKGVNFVETLSDTLIGDIKNNIVLSQTDGSNRIYSLNMTGEQLPKYMTAAFSFFCAGIRSNNSDDIERNGASKLLVDIFLNENEPYVNNVFGNVVIDEHDRITGFDGKLIITGYDEAGSARNLTFDINITVDSFGTTYIEKVNADEYEDLSSRILITDEEETSVNDENETETAVIGGAVYTVTTDEDVNFDVE